MAHRETQRENMLKGNGKRNSEQRTANSAAYAQFSALVPLIYRIVVVVAVVLPRKLLHSLRSPRSVSFCFSVVFWLFFFFFN